MSNIEKRPVGRPPKFPSIRALKEGIAKYQADMKEQKRPQTVTGLAMALGTSRQVLCNIEHLDSYGEEFIDAIKKAKMECEVALEERLITGQGSTAGVIFALKNNYGWRDKQEIETTQVNPAQQLLDRKNKVNAKRKAMAIDPIEEAVLINSEESLDEKWELDKERDHE